MRKDETIKDMVARSFERDTPMGRVINQQREEETAEWIARSGKKPAASASTSTPAEADGNTRTAPGAPRAQRTPTTARPASSPSTFATGPSSGTAITAAGPAASPPISQAHAQRLTERGLNPILCAQLGVHSVDARTLGFHYLVGGTIHNTKLRRGKGDMPWAQAGRELVLWNVDCLRDEVVADEELIITEGEFDAIACLQVGFTRVCSVPNGAQSSEQGFAFLHRGGQLRADLEKIGRFIIATDGDHRGRECRDALAVRLGDERCRWVEYPAGCKDANDVLKAHGAEALREIINGARPMWTDEVATLDDIPDPPEDEARYRLGIPRLDEHGIRITLPALWAIIGPYSSGKSVLLRQVLVNLWRLHKWRAMLTSFEERVKPRYLRDLRRHLIGRPLGPASPWTVEEIAAADDEIRNGFVFLRRAKGKPIDPARLLDRIEYAVRVYGIRVVAIDPANEVRLRPGPGQLKTDFLGDFLMDLKDLGEDYGLCIIVCAHTGKEATERKLKRGAMLTLNDGEDTRHWGGKSDMGWVMWRNVDGPSMLNIDRTKDHETMGKPMLCELELDRSLNKFSVARTGYDILKQEGER